MKTFYTLGYMNLLNLVYGASKNKLGTFNSLSSDFIIEIASFFDNPFPNIGSINRYTRDSLSAYPVKRLFKKCFPDIPELITDDIDDYEPEIRIILPLSKFTDPAILYEALKFEFIHGNTFNVLLPKLIKYFDRVGTIESNSSVIHALMERKRFDILFHNEAIWFHKYASVILDSDCPSGFSRLKRLMEYIISNPDHFEHIKKAWRSKNVPRSFVSSWNKLVLALNAPDTFFFSFPRITLGTFDKDPTIWDGIVIPKDFYPKIFERINTIINSSCSIDDYYPILNMIRFGPDELEFSENQIQYMRCFLDSKLFQFLVCASLSNKMDLFDKLLSNISYTKLASYYNYFDSRRYGPIELQKVILDIHGSEYYTFYDDAILLSKVSKQYKVTSIQYGNAGLKVELTISTVPNEDYPVPYRINLHPNIYWNSINNTLNDLEFDNAAVLERFFPGYFEILESHSYPRSEIYISAANLKIIAQSESTCKLLRTILTESPKSISLIVTNLGFFTNLLDESVLPKDDILRKYFVFSFIKPVNIKNYFEYRHVFKYLIQTGQEISREIDESVLKLLRLDFPNGVIKLSQQIIET